MEFARKQGHSSAAILLSERRQIAFSLDLILDSIFLNF